MWLKSVYIYQIYRKKIKRISAVFGTAEALKSALSSALYVRPSVSLGYLTLKLKNTSPLERF